MKNEVLDVIIIGGGVGGSTVALYLARAGYKPMIITNGEIGGKLNDIDTIQNYVGIKDANGEDVASNIYEQLIQSGLNEDKEIRTYTEVLSINRYNSNLWEVLIKSDLSDETEKVFSKNVVIATGMEKIKLPQIDEGLQHNCVLCDGFMYKDRDVLVVGGGSSAFTEALELSKTSSHVTILSRSKYYKAEQFLIDKVNKTENINILHGELYSGGKNGDKLELHANISGRRVRLKVNGLFTYIGSKPNNSFLPEYVMKDVYGHVVRKGNNAISDDGIIDNMYVVGDITTTTAKQFGISIGQATMTATELINKL